MKNPAPDGCRVIKLREFVLLNSSGVLLAVYGFHRFPFCLITMRRQQGI